MGRLQGKVAIVTGAGQQGNIGLAVCEAFLREGAAGVIGTDLKTGQAEAITARIAGQFGNDRFRLLQQDVTAAADWQRVADETIQLFGGIDVLVNNAGISTWGGVLDTPLETMRQAMAVNHDALYLGIQVCTPALSAAVHRHPGGGAIINNLSMSSFMTNANNVAYHVSKAAGRMLTLCAAKELGARKIRVNSVHPGVTMTPMIEHGLGAYVELGVWKDTDEALAALTAMSPLQTVGQPEDAAHAFVYLASEEARFVTGAALYHDGGLGGIY